MQTELISKITNEQKDYALGYVRFLEKLKKFIFNFYWLKPSPSAH